jgi:hypothetical protein
MKKIIILLGLLFILGSVKMTAQTDYFYYYKGEKQYLKLDTKHIFVSVADENMLNMVEPNITKTPLRVDIPKKIQSRNNKKRFWTRLSVETDLSDHLYLAKLSEIRKSRKRIIVSPYFKTQNHDKIGLSNFFYVKLKSLDDTVTLKQEIEKEHAIIVNQNQFMPLWFVASITEDSKYNAMEIRYPIF